MNSVYESLRALLRAKELEIKKLEKEIEALRIVLPIVAEAGNTPHEAEAPSAGSAPKAKAAAAALTAADFESVMAQAAVPQTERNIQVPDLTPKPRTSWP